jgi:platelet-activating factor acetylhydrolase
MVFSHGLGGTRNTYSHLCGSIASHGVVVVAPDHRDGSSPISYIRATKSSKARTVDHKRTAHEATPEVLETRHNQLKIRLWEIGLVHSALLAIDTGKDIHNLDPNSTSSRKKDFNEVLGMFHDRLDIHRPGAIAWAGHSFGGATMYQFVKSVFYRPNSEEFHTPLFSPSSADPIVKQITPASPLILLDMWCLPLQSPSTAWLQHKPLPCYADSGPGGKVVLAVLSEAFFKWRSHLEQTKTALSEYPSRNLSDEPHQQSKKSPPRFFYPVGSAHLSQSDFGIVFPWVAKKLFNAQEPERSLRLNVRAILQVLREADWIVEDTSSIDKEEEKSTQSIAEGNGQDWKILDSTGKVRGWVALTTNPDPDAESDQKSTETKTRLSAMGELDKGQHSA